MPIDFNITEHDFKSQIQGTKPYLFKNALKEHAIDWKLVNELISRHDHTSSNFKLLKNGLILKYDYLEQYQEVFTAKYRASKLKLYELMRSGASLALNKIENCPETDKIRTQIAHFTGRQTIVSGYAAFGSEPSFGNHWDTHDVFAVQLIGKKRWTIYAPTETNPLYKNSSVGKEHQCIEPPVMDIVLEAGDVFYLPRGWWHEVTASGDETFHLAVSTYPPYVTDYLNWLVEDISTKSEIFRAPVEPGAPANSSWEDLGGQLSEAIQCMENQNRFSQWFSSLQRLDSPYAIELFGNEKATPIPPESRIFVNANNCHIWQGNEFVANGIRLKLNGLSKSIIKIITQHQGIQIDALVARFPEMPGSRIESFIIELIKQDVLAIHLPS